MISKTVSTTIYTMIFTRLFKNKFTDRKLHRPSVLVLDEATSSLDTETEHEVMKAVQALQGDKTVIIVAHRLSTVEYCDRLYRLDAGRIVDEGTFDEVMNRSQS